MSPNISNFKETARVIIAVPLAGPMIYWRTVAGILELDKPEDSDLMVFQGALVDRARNILVERMLEHPMEPTHLLFLDADIILPQNGLMSLLQIEKPIVSGLYRRRLPPHEPMAFIKKGQKLAPMQAKGPSLARVNAVGAGCLLIERKVFEKIKGPWFVSEWRKDGHLSEDFSFCKKAQAAGFPIFVNRFVKALHLETMAVGTNPEGEASFLPLK